MNVKVTVIERDQSVTECEIRTGSGTLDKVKEFLDLSSRLTKEGKCEGKIDRRAQAANQEKLALYALINSQKKIGAFDCLLDITGFNPYVWQ